MSAMVDELEQAQSEIRDVADGLKAGLDKPLARPAARTAVEQRRAASSQLAFYALTAIIGLALSALGLASASWPWYTPAQPFLGMQVEAHRWHGAQFAALLAILLGGSLLTLLRRPRRAPLLAQYLIASSSIIAALFAVFVGPVALALAVPFAAIAALYPDRAALLDISSRERWSRPLGALSVITAALLIQPTYLALSYQILYPHSEHSEHFHWVAAAALAIALALGGLLATTRRPGWRILSALVGSAYAYLGLAAIAVPTHAGSWGVAGGVVAAVAGALYVALAMIPGRQLEWYESGVRQ
jgi:hypothetical protein